jgi:hypothetical protein
VALFRIRDLERRADIITRSESRRKFKTADTILREDARDTLDAASFDIFLSHSYLNADDVLALKAEIESMGFGVYVDWVVDSHTNREDVTKETADLIRERMGQCKSLFYVTSSEAADSKWMPWELGYFERGIKGTHLFSDGLGDAEHYCVEGSADAHETGVTPCWMPFHEREGAVRPREAA